MKLKKTPARKGEHDNPHYAAMVESLDDGVGMVMNTLKRLGLEENTVVMFFSDNGGLSTLEGPHTPATNHPLRQGKGWLYEGGIRVPLIVRWPGVTPKAARCQTPVISDDLFPTIAEMVGLKPQRYGAKGSIDGVSFVDLLKAPEQKRLARALYWHYPHYPRQGSRPAGAIRVGNYKLIEHYEGNRLELFNLGKDMGERRDLSKHKPKLTAKLQQQLNDWRKKVGAQMPRPNPRHDAKRPFRDAYWMPNKP